MSLQVGRQLLHYRIVEQLGEGGMGIVYVAHDTKLGRDVALKVVSARMAGDAERRNRFEREARAVAALNHPNIVTIYSFEEADGLRFITMELVRGHKLTQRIPPGGLSFREVLQMALPLTEAVGAAHELGIIHRDLKPDNIVIRNDGRPKVLDFGLAKLCEEDGGSVAGETVALAATTEGTILGTVDYLSPEQAQGQPVDARSDVFSLGIVLYEMATGSRPFRGGNAIATISSILKDDPPAPEEVNPSLPAGLGRVLRRCLAKEPAQRYDNARVLHDDLRALANTAVAPAPWAPSRRFRVAAGVVLAIGLAAAGLWLLRGSGHSSVGPAMVAAQPNMIVVFPFENLGRSEDAYFAAGVTDEIIARLSTIAGVGVIARTTALGYERAGKTLADIRADLGVSFILDGTIRWDRTGGAEGRVRITPQLVRIADGTSVWSNSYDRLLQDIFAIQSEIADRVVENVDASLLLGKSEATKLAYTNNLEAYAFYLQAKEHAAWGGGPAEKDLRLALQLLDKAVALDPGFAAAHAKLSEVHSSMHFRAHDATDARLLLAKQAADRALALDPQLPDAHLAKGLYHYRSDRDYPRALRALEKARELAPSRGDVVWWTGVVRKRQGRFQEATEVLQRAFELDPRNLSIPIELAVVHECMSDYATASAWLDRVILFEPSLPNRMRRARLHVLWHGSAAEMRRVLESEAGGPHTAWAEVRYYERRFPEALQILASLQVDAGENPYQFGMNRLNQARIHRLLEQPEESRRCAGEAVPVLEGLAREYDFSDAELGVAYAYLGRGEEARQYAQLALDRYPPSRDALLGAEIIELVAEIHWVLDDPGSALEFLARRLELNGLTSVRSLQLNPLWDGLREHPGYRELVRKHREQS